MLSAARRAASSQVHSPAVLLYRHNLLASIVLPHRIQQAPPRSFSTGTPSQDAIRTGPSKAKLAERATKLARKRSLREKRQMREATKAEAVKVEEQRRLAERKEKQAVASEISETLPPFSEEQLETMYQGLISAPPEEFAMPALASSKVPALPDPTAEAHDRQDRLALLSQRLDELGLDEEVPTSDVTEGGSLTERLRRRTGEGLGERVTAEQPTTAMAEGKSAAESLLDRILALDKESALDIPRASSAPEAASLPRGLLARGEWTDLILACAREGSAEAVLRGLQAMERTVPLTDGKVLEDTLALYAGEGRPQDALVLANFARKNSLPLSVNAHHHLLTSLLPSHPELAVRQLYLMEAAGYTPLLATYTAVIQRLFSPASPPALVRQGWDLYAHTRLVSHPVPSVELYSTMIQATSHGAHPAPERAIDLFTELTDDNRLPPSELAYNGVIRACAREGSQEYYFEALRFMRRMLDENVAPSRHTFHALLEGAKRHGDLARARWMLVKMVGVGGDLAPDQNSLALVFQTYAAYRPESRERRARRTKAEATPAAPSRSEGAADGQPSKRPSAVLTPAQDPTTPVAAPSSLAGPLAIIELLGESSLFYPGPLPQTSAEIVEEAKNLMLQVVEPSALGSSSTGAASSQPFESRTFPSVRPSTFLLNAYLSILNSHAPFSSSVAFFNTAYETLSLPKNRYTFELLMRRSELAKNREEGVTVAKAVFEEWIRWTEERCPAVVEAEGRELDESDRRKVEEQQSEWERERRNGRNVSKMWGGLIRVFARAFLEPEALALLRRFVATYPPSNVARYSPSSSTALSPAPSHPVFRTVRLSSPLYPETSPSATSSLPPYLLFEDLKLLHLRFANMEDKVGLATVKGVSKAYEGALGEFRRRARKEK
ncbi:hypothetical protein JCM21900_002994 [Sporobolomyces salmonicolor]